MTDKTAIIVQKIKSFSKKKSSLWLVLSIAILLLFTISAHLLRSDNLPSKAAAEFMNSLLQGTPDETLNKLSPNVLEGLNKAQKIAKLQEFRSGILQGDKVQKIQSKKAKSKDFGITISVPVKIELEHNGAIREQKEIIKMQYINKEWKVLL
ncbi:MAG: hypothetical protein IJ566_04165 [Cardiobacteriaceae bacterium]|nr:hypothetical protein [Cardiobacteriaceae bacterium]